MSQFFKKISKQTLSFAVDQFVVLFLALTAGLKFAFLYDKILKLDWYGDHFSYGIYLGFIGILALFSPIFLAKKYKNRLAVILATLLALLLVIDTVYYSYFQSLPTVGLLSSAGQAADIGPAIADLIKWWHLLYFIDIAVLIMTWGFIKKYIQKIKTKLNVTKLSGKTSLVFTALAILAFWISILSPGISKLNEIMDRGYDMAWTAHHYGVYVAHGIDLARFVNESTTTLSNKEQEQISNWVTSNKPPQSISSLNGVAKGKNIIMIQVESLGGFVINQRFNDKEITPNLNKIASESQFFPNDRFLYGAGHTSDTDFVSNTSYFPLDDAATFVRYGRDNFTSLPKTLIKNNYSAYAYHGFNRNFWNRDAALSSIGYQKFYAEDNYPKGAKINMGLNDGDFLLKTADYIKTQPKPSLSYAITLTSHVPFSMTGEENDLAIKAEDYPNQVGGYIENIHYTDKMLGRFFEKLKKLGLYEDSLIVIYGDHTPVLPKFTAGTINYDPESVQQKEVPLIFKLPGNEKGRTFSDRGSHLDITPTILDLVGIKSSQLVFGRSLFADSSKFIQECPNQIATFTKLGDCATSLSSSKNISSKIIRYNQFKKLP